MMSTKETRLDIKALYHFFESSLRAEYKDLLKSDAVQTWFDGLIWENRGMSLATAQKYLETLHGFLEYANSRPDTMVEDARKSLRNPDHEFKYPRKVKAWGKELNHQGVSWNVMVKKMSIIRSFFWQNEAKIDLKLPKRERPPFPFVPEKVLLRRAFLTCEPKSVQRSWILSQSQCGLSEIDLLILDVDRDNQDKTKCDGLIFDSIRKQYTQGRCPIEIVIPRTKEHITTITFLGEESTSLMTFYGNHLFPWKIGKDPGRTVRYHFEKLQDILGENRLHPHVLRKYFQTTLENADFHPNSVKRMMGHSLGETEGAYSGSAIKVLRNKYVRVYPSLRLFEKKRLGELSTLSMADISEEELTSLADDPVSEEDA